MPFDISPNDADLLVAIDERLLRSILWTLVDDGTINLIQTLSDGSIVTILGFDIRLKPRPGGAAIGLTFSASVDSTQSSSGPNACDGMVWASAVVPLVTMFAPNFRQTIAASFSGVDLADVSTQGFGRDLFCSEQVRQGAWLALRGFGTIPLMPGIAARRFELDVLTTADDRRLLVVGAELPSEWGGGRLDMRRLSIPIDRDDTIWVYVGGQIIVGAAWQLLRRVSRSDFIRDAVEEESSGAPDQEKTYATDLIQAQMDSRGGWLPTVVYRPETYWLEIVSPNGKKFRIDEAHLFSDLDADGVADYRETPLELVITSNKNIPQQIAVQPGDSLSITTSLGGHGAVAFGGAGVLSLPSGLSERIDIPGLSFEYVDSRLRIRLAVPAGDPHRLSVRFMGNLAGALGLETSHEYVGILAAPWVIGQWIDFPHYVNWEPPNLVIRFRAHDPDIFCDSDFHDDVTLRIAPHVHYVGYILPTVDADVRLPPFFDNVLRLLLQFVMLGGWDAIGWKENQIEGEIGADLTTRILTSDVTDRLSFVLPDTKGRHTEDARIHVIPRRMWGYVYQDGLAFGGTAVVGHFSAVGDVYRWSVAAQADLYAEKLPLGIEFEPMVDLPDFEGTHVETANAAASAINPYAPLDLHKRFALAGRFAGGNVTAGEGNFLSAPFVLSESGYFAYPRLLLDQFARVLAGRGCDPADVDRRAVSCDGVLTYLLTAPNPRLRLL